MSGTKGLAPVAIMIERAVSVFPFTSTLCGDVIFASPSIHSTPSPVYRLRESCGSIILITF